MSRWLSTTLFFGIIGVFYLSQAEAGFFRKDAVLSEPALAETQDDCCCWEILAELRAAYYQPTGERFREIYSGAGLYNLEVSFETWCNIYPFVSVGYFRKSGKSINGRNRTTLTMVPIDVGLKYFFKNCSLFAPYVGAGVVVNYGYIKNKSSFVREKQREWGVGGVVKAGVLKSFHNCLFLDVFADYTYLKYKFPKGKGVLNNRGDLSGLAIGGGIGYSF